MWSGWCDGVGHTGIGMAVEGIFRRSANSQAVKEAKVRLEEGMYDVCVSACCDGVWSRTDV